MEYNIKKNTDEKVRYMRKEVIVARDLVKNYGSFAAVKGVSFKVFAGECFGLLGPNGAGKTSVARMIYGLSPITSGSLEVFGEDITVASRRIKANIGVVPQEDNLDPELTIRDNLLVYAGYFRMPRDLAQRRAEEIMKYMALEDKATAVVEQLSGGLKRRLTIGRALLNQPAMLILDEPTTGLDPHARQLVWQRLKKLKEAGTTLLLTTHYLEEADWLCDRLIIFFQGEILEQGAPRELLERHTGGQAVELGVEAATLEKLLEGCESLVKARQQRGEDQILFTHQGQELADFLRHKSSQLAVPIRYQRVRPANLEDVFLKLTGGSLAGGEEKEERAEHYG